MKYTRQEGFAYFSKVEPVNEKERSSIFDKFGKRLNNWHKNYKEQSMRNQAEAIMAGEAYDDALKAGLPYRDMAKKRGWDNKEKYQRDVDQYYRMNKKNLQSKAFGAITVKKKKDR